MYSNNIYILKCFSFEEHLDFESGSSFCYSHSTLGDLLSGIVFARHDESSNATPVRRKSLNWFEGAS